MCSRPEAANAKDVEWNANTCGYLCSQNEVLEPQESLLMHSSPLSSSARPSPRTLRLCGGTRATAFTHDDTQLRNFPFRTGTFTFSSARHCRTTKSRRRAVRFQVIAKGGKKFKAAESSRSLSWNSSSRDARSATRAWRGHDKRVSTRSPESSSTEHESRSSRHTFHYRRRPRNFFPDSSFPSSFFSSKVSLSFSLGYERRSRKRRHCRPEADEEHEEGLEAGRRRRREKRKRARDDGLREVVRVTAIFQTTVPMTLRSSPRWSGRACVLRPFFSITSRSFIPAFLMSQSGSAIEGTDLIEATIESFQIACEETVKIFCAHRVQVTAALHNHDHHGGIVGQGAMVSEPAAGNSRSSNVFLEGSIENGEKTKETWEILGPFPRWEL